MIDETLYQQPESRFCRKCGSQLNTALTRYKGASTYDARTGELKLIWHYQCPNKTKKWTDAHSEYNDYVLAKKKDAPGPTLYDITIYYRVQTGMERQTISNTTDDSMPLSSKGMIMFHDTVNNKFIKISVSDILRIDTIEKKQN